MNKNALILHGAGNNSKGNWFSWLKKELERKNYKVWSPDLPNSDVPIQKDWLNTIFSNKDWEINEKSVMIGHSSGATLILRILERLPKNVKIAKAILVACPTYKGTIPEHRLYKENLTKDPFQWRKIKSHCHKFYFIHSDNDPYECGIDQGEILHANLGGELILRSGQGHFNIEASSAYKKFPELLEYI